MRLLYHSKSLRAPVDRRRLRVPRRRRRPQGSRRACPCAPVVAQIILSIARITELAIVRINQARRPHFLSKISVADALPHRPRVVRPDRRRPRRQRPPPVQGSRPAHPWLGPNDPDSPIGIPNDSGPDQIALHDGDEAGPMFALTHLLDGTPLTRVLCPQKSHLCPIDVPRTPRRGRKQTLRRR